MKLKTLLSLSALALTTAVTANAQKVLVHRLVAIANAQYGGSSFVPTDSTSLYYSALRTSDMKTGIYKYDSAVVYAYKSGYNLFSKTTNTFYLNDSVVFFRQYYWADTTSQWNLYSATHFTYNSTIVRDSVKETQIDTGSGLKNYEQDIYFYNTNGNISAALNHTWTGVSWFNQDSTAYTYNASKNLINVLGMTFNKSTGNYDNRTQSIYSYNTSGQLTKDIIQNWNLLASSWETQQRDAYTYDPSGNLSTATHFLPDASGVLTLSSKDSSSYDASQNLIAQVNMIYDTTAKVFVNNSMYTISYDTSNRPLVYTTQTWNGSGWIYTTGQDVQTHYYYDLYADTSVSVNNVNNIVAFDVYPIPASAFFSMNIGWKNAQPFTVGIYDINGRLVKQWSEKATAKYHKTVPVSELGSGNYFIKISSSNGQLGRQISIVH